MEDAYFHQSHLEKKQDYGHEAVGVMLSCNDLWDELLLLDFCASLQFAHL